jgi:probable addiction module antidote protein
MKTTKWDMADNIKTKEDVVLYLEAALEENDPELLLATLGDISRSKGMTHLARELNVSRESLYVSLSENGNPSFTTIFKLLNILGFHLSIKKTIT